MFAQVQKMPVSLALPLGAAASIAFLLPTLMIAFSFIFGDFAVTQVLFAYLFPAPHHLAVPALGLAIYGLLGLRFYR